MLHLLPFRHQYCKPHSHENEERAQILLLELEALFKALEWLVSLRNIGIALVL